MAPAIADKEKNGTANAIWKEKQPKPQHQAGRTTADGS